MANDAEGQEEVCLDHVFALLRENLPAREALLVELGIQLGILLDGVSLTPEELLRWLQTESPNLGVVPIESIHSDQELSRICAMLMVLGEGGLY